MNDPVTVIIVHALTALPPTLVALAALVTAFRSQSHMREIKVRLNGKQDRLEQRIEALEHRHGADKND